MKRILLASAAVLLVATGGLGWYVLQHRDPLVEAKALLTKGDYRSAGLQLRTAVRDEPDNAEAHALLAQLQLAGDDPIAAEREIKRAMELKWDRMTSVAILSQAYVREKKWKEIVAEIPTQGATADQTGYLLMTRAVAQYGLGDKAVAAATLAEAKQAAPKSADVYLTAARMAVDDRKPEVAAMEVDHALELAPRRPEALQLKANLLAAQGEQAKALVLLDQAVEAAPQRDDIRTQRAGLLLAVNQDDKAAADIDILMSRKPPSAVARYVKVVLLVRQRKFAEADALIAQLDPVLPQLPRGLYFKAMIKGETGQMAQAEEAIGSYVNRFPNDADAVRMLASLELQTRHPDRAIAALTKSIQAGQRDPETLDLLGRAYAMTGNQAEAQRVLQQAADATKTPQQLTRLASARLQVGDLSGAASDLQRAVDAAPSQPGAAEALIGTSIRLGQLDRAQEALDKLRQQTGDTEIVANLTGLLHIARLEPDAAVTAFAEGAKRFPDSVVLRLNEAKVLLQLNRGNDAVAVLKEILDKSPVQAEALTLMVQTLLQQGRGPDALAYAERARVSEPTNLGLINGEAQLYGRLQQYQKAIDLIEAARVGGRIPVPLLATLGSLQFAAGQGDAAKQTFADLVAAEPTNLNAIVSSMDLLVRLKDFDGARQVADAAIRQQPGNLTLMQSRLRVDLIDGGIDKALQTAERLRADPANLPAAATLKGGLLMGTQRFAEAAKEYGAEFQKAPSTALVIGLAEAKQASGDRAGATADLTKYQAAHPDDVAVAQILAGVQIGAHEYDAAERNLLIVLKQEPTNVPALNNLAWVYLQKGDKRAREIAQRAFEQTPTPEVADTLGWVLVSQGDASKGLPLLERAAAASPQNASIKYHIAVALKTLGRNNDAIEMLRPIVQGAEFDEKGQAQSLLAELSKAKP